MIARGISREGLEAAALESGVRLVNLRQQGKGYAFKLGLQGELWRRLSPSGRKVAAVCYHGHAAFLRQVFAAEPQAVIISAMFRYDGVASFQANACSVGETNIGGSYNPTGYAEACTCDGALARADV